MRILEGCLNPGVSQNITGHSFRSGRTDHRLTNKVYDKNNSDLYLLGDHAQTNHFDRDRASQGSRHREVNSLAYNDVGQKKSSQVVFPPLRRRY